MTLHLRETANSYANVYDVRYGSKVINRIYKGSTLIWQKTAKIFESSTPGTYTVDLTGRAGRYRVICVGGGGGSSTWAGGAGAYIDITFIASGIANQGGTFTIVVGSGGAGAGAYSRNNNGYAGGTSSVTWGNGGKYISCQGGQGAIGLRKGDENGGSSTYTYAPTISGLTTYTINAQSSYYRPRQDSWYGGYGTGGNAAASTKSAGNAGTGGYVLIERV